MLEILTSAPVQSTKVSPLPHFSITTSSGRPYPGGAGGGELSGRRGQRPNGAAMALGPERPQTVGDPPTLMRQNKICLPTCV